jgi:hypothetical protein
VRFVENNVEMAFPDGSWDTVTRELGEPLVLSDPATGQAGIYTTILQNDTQTFVAIRLRVVNARIVEVEHVLSTRRNLSSPPTPIGDVFTYKRDPDFTREVAASERASRAMLVAHANGYFDTLQFNNGEIRGTRFAPGATRNENGLLFTAIEQGFRSGRYRFNNRVRDREVGVPRAATWAFLESFKVKNDQITAVEATFTDAPYFIRSPFTRKPDPVYDALRD